MLATYRISYTRLHIIEQTSKRYIIASPYCSVFTDKAHQVFTLYSYLLIPTTGPTYNQALDESKTINKGFDGSGWCGYCVFLKTKCSGKKVY